MVSYDAAQHEAVIRQRNVIREGDVIEFYGPGFRHSQTKVENLRLAATGEAIDRAPNPMELLLISVSQEVQPGDMIRKNEEGLINLYKENGQAVTVRA